MRNNNNETIPVEPTPITRRLGTFHLPLSVMRINPEKYLPLLSRVIVVEAKYSFSFDAIEYTAFSNDFEPLPDGVQPKHYFLTNVESGFPTFSLMEKAQ
jgi:hypothetical protein